MIDGSLGPFPEMASLRLDLKLFPRQPFYSITISRDESSQHDQAKIKEVMVSMETSVRFHLQPENGARQISRKVVEDLAHVWEAACYHAEFDR